MKNRILKKDFFGRKTLTVAKELLGCFLCRKIRGKTKKYKITEVEAYVGPRDLASHASRGKTERNSVMFGEAGNFYIYFTYGMHWMLNIVTEEKDYPAAILIRGVEGIAGPGRLTKKLKIDKKLNGKPAVPANGLWFEELGNHRGLTSVKIKRSARIGVAYAGPVWVNKKYRFILEDQRLPSRPKSN